MDPKGIQTSFIPKKTLVQKSFDSKSGDFATIFLIISIIIFITSGLVYGLLYFWSSRLDTQLKKLEADLVIQKDNLQSEIVLFEDLVRFDKKLKVATTLLNQHTTIRPFFQLLSDNTLKTVRFKNLSYKMLDTGGAEVKMSGEAKSFNSIALQSNAFASTKAMSNIVFSGLNTGRDNTVIFDFSTNVKDLTTSYAKFKENNK